MEAALKRDDMFSVAIDGPAGAGKSSVARAAAKELGFIYADTGALYRTVTLYLLRHGVDLNDARAVGAALPQVKIGLLYEDGEQKVTLCGEEVTEQLRTEEVSRHTPLCAAMPAVRDFLLELQRGLAKEYNVLMDGRDIGTVVLPDAPLKIFLTASAEERARRRAAQLRATGEEADYAAILRDILERDERDSHRETAPLKRAEDAVLLDTSSLSFEESVAAVVELVNSRLPEQGRQ